MRKVSRRSVIGGVAAVASPAAAMAVALNAGNVTQAVAVAAGGDAELLEMIGMALAKWKELDEALDALERTAKNDPGYEAARRLEERAQYDYKAYYGAIIDTPARTMEGMRAKAKFLFEHSWSSKFDALDGSLSGELAMSIVGDLIGVEYFRAEA